MIIDNGSPKVSLNEVVLFPFDDFSIPFTDGLRLHLLQKIMQVLTVKLS